jgi:hypothetical protein
VFLRSLHIGSAHCWPGSIQVGIQKYEYCRFEMFFLDVSKFILKNYPSHEKIFENFQKHEIENMGRFTPISALVACRNDINTYKKIYSACDTIGMNLGLIISSFLEFKKV